MKNKYRELYSKELFYLWLQHLIRRVNMNNIIDEIEWALETKRQKLTFGLDEKDAVYAREKRLFGVLLDCKKEITSLQEELELLRNKCAESQLNQENNK